MKGTMYRYAPGSLKPEIEELDHRPDLKWYKAKLDGGWIELVPGFNNIRINGQTHPCIVFCDEEGKLKSLPFNEAATIAWSDALPGGLLLSDGTLADALVGPVLVLVGDEEFMREL